MDGVKYIGMDMHEEAISVAVLNFWGKLVMECTIETKASTILDFLKGLRGSLHVTFEEGTWAAWLCDLIKPHVTELVVCITERKARTTLLKRGGLDGKKTSSHRRSVFFLTPFIEPVRHANQDFASFVERFETRQVSHPKIMITSVS